MAERDAAAKKYKDNLDVCVFSQPKAVAEYFFRAFRLAPLSPWRTSDRTHQTHHGSVSSHHSHNGISTRMVNHLRHKTLEEQREAWDQLQEVPSLAYGHSWCRMASRICTQAIQKRDKQPPAWLRKARAFSWQQSMRRFPRAEYLISPVDWSVPAVSAMPTTTLVSSSISQSTPKTTARPFRATIPSPCDLPLVKRPVCFSRRSFVRYRRHTVGCNSKWFHRRASVRYRGSHMVAAVQDSLPATYCSLPVIHLYYATRHKNLKLLGETLIVSMQQSVHEEKVLLSHACILPPMTMCGAPLYYAFLSPAGC